MAISLSNIKRKNIVKTLHWKITLKICGHMNTNLTNEDYIMRMLATYSLMLWSICLECLLMIHIRKFVTTQNK